MGKNHPFNPLKKERGGALFIMIIVLILFMAMAGAGTLTRTFQSLQGQSLVKENLSSFNQIVAFALRSERVCTLNFRQNGVSKAKLNNPNFRHSLRYLFSYSSEILIDLSSQASFNKINITELELLRPQALVKAQKPEHMELSVNQAYLVELEVRATGKISRDRDNFVVESVPVYVVTNNQGQIEYCQATRFLDHNKISRTIAGVRHEKKAYHNTTLEDRACQIRHGVTQLDSSTAYKFDPVYKQCVEVHLDSVNPILSSNN